MRRRAIRVVFRPEAEADLNSLFDYIRGEAGARRAGDYVRQVHLACLALNTFPNRGGPRSDYGEGVRVLSFRRRVTIAYRVGNEVEILAVLYAGLDVADILSHR